MDMTRRLRKNMTQQSRAGGTADATVTFAESMKVNLKKEVFLSNPRNKRRFINMLSWCLQQNNCPKYQAKGDADVRIVRQPWNLLRKRTLYLSAKTWTYLSRCASTSARIARTEKKKNSKRR